MQLTVTITSKITFAIEYFEANEGGMTHECYAQDIPTIQLAVVKLAEANAVRPSSDWIITADVETLVK